MFITREEEDILEGEMGTGRQKAMEILVALGKVFDAEELIPIGCRTRPSGRGVSPSFRR